MRLLKYLTIILFLASTSCTELVHSPAPTYAHITQEDQFRSLIIGRRLSDSGGSVVFNSDGTYDGHFAAGRFYGVWAWQDGYFCRSGVYGKREVPSDCKRIEIDGNSLLLIGAKGKGQVVQFRINQPNALNTN